MKKKHLWPSHCQLWQESIGIVLGWVPQNPCWSGVRYRCTAALEKVWRRESCCSAVLAQPHLRLLCFTLWCFVDTTFFTKGRLVALLQNKSKSTIFPKPCAHFVFVSHFGNSHNTANYLYYYYIWHADLCDQGSHIITIAIFGRHQHSK
jgi:hypothetical protein